MHHLPLVVGESADHQLPTRIGPREKRAPAGGVVKSAAILCCSDATALASQLGIGATMTSCAHLRRGLCYDLGHDPAASGSALIHKMTKSNSPDNAIDDEMADATAAPANAKEIGVILDAGPEGACSPIDEPRSAPIKLPFPAFYDERRRRYLVQTTNGVWIDITGSQLKRRLRNNGVLDDAVQDFLIQSIEDKKGFRYAAPLAGRSEGFYEENGNRFFVTESPRLVTPKPGEWQNLQRVIHGLLVGRAMEHGEDQRHAFLGWLQTAVIALQAGRRQDAPALVIAGPPNCGKSFLQNLLTECLGGRAAKAARYMSGKTHFNGELFEAEHLMLEDETLDHSMKSRLKLASAIKSVTVSTKTQSCHRKSDTAINLPIRWRLTITLNDEPYALRMLPPLETLGTALFPSKGRGKQKVHLCGNRPTQD